MDWGEWKPLYDEIVNRLDIDPARDYEATHILSQLLIEIEPSPLLTELENTIRNKDIIVFGSGPSLEEHIELVMNDREFMNAVYVTADGATSALVERGVNCHIIVTDLDGDINDIMHALDNGALAIVHAHGDNIPLVSEYVPKMTNVLGSTQVKPLSNVFLWGGFTDGDRACYLVSHYSPKRIILAGMDFGDVVGKWSKPSHTDNFVASPRKRIKLAIAQMLLNRLWDITEIPYLNLSLI